MPYYEIDYCIPEENDRLYVKAKNKKEAKKKVEDFEGCYLVFDYCETVRKEDIDEFYEVIE